MTFDLVRWLRHEALPLWADIGFEPRAGLFHEKLDLDARPVNDTPRRLMVQARQIYVFALAAMLGWYPGAGLAEQAGDTMLRLYAASGGRDGFAFSVTPNGPVHDDERDLYAQAFALFALAWLMRLTGRRRYLDVADATLAFLDARMATPATGGYNEFLVGRPTYRRQNPHMHLVEALLALHEADPARGYIDRAEQLVGLMHRRFLHGAAPTLVETYDERLRPVEGPPFCFEPGHHFEWAWLLSEHARLAGRAAPRVAGALWASAAASVAADGTISDAFDDTGRIRLGSTRLWPHAEAIRASTLADLPGVELRRIACRDSTLDTLARRFLLPAHPGCWIDHYDGAGRPLSDFVPASSLYHLAGAAHASFMTKVGTARHGT